ncbi:MAG: Calx-beta domain-containing protein [Kiloniellales bacterium]|nr:Calx-beta domain-containing protein [Kiloniellales bacterium]
MDETHGDRGRRRTAARRPAPGGAGERAARRALALPLLAAAWLCGAQAALGASFTLEDGRRIEGEIVYARGSSLMIRETSGALVQVGRSAVQRVELKAGKAGKVAGDLLGWDQGVYEIDTAEAVLMVKGRKVLEERRVIPKITVASAEESEAAAEMVFELALSRPVKAEVLLIYATADGTAMAGSDYEAARGSVILAPGATSAVVTITLLDDQLAEGDESFELLVTSDMDLSEVKVQRAAAKILDDEPPQEAQQ